MGGDWKADGKRLCQDPPCQVPHGPTGPQEQHIPALAVGCGVPPGSPRASPSAIIVPLAYLQDHSTDLSHTQDNGIRHSRHSDSALCGVGKQVPCHLHLSTCSLQTVQGPLVTATAAQRKEVPGRYEAIAHGPWPSWRGWVPSPLTSRISLILVPALPISEPHWLAGMTRRKVTGGLETFPPFAGAAQRSCGAWTEKRLCPYLPLCSPPPLQPRARGSLPLSHKPGSEVRALLCWPATDLIQLEGDHGDSMEDSCCGPSDGGDALGAGALGDGDPGTALWVQDGC